MSARGGGAPGAGAMVGVDSSTPYSAAGMKSHHPHWPTPKALDATKIGAIATKIAKYPRLWIWTPTPRCIGLISIWGKSMDQSTVATTTGRTFILIDSTNQLPNSSSTAV